MEADERIPRSRTTCKTLAKENAVLLLTLLGVVLGFAIGFGVRELHPSDDAIMWIGMPGELFLRMLNMLIVPLIVGSVISGTASLDPKSNGKMSLVAFVWILCTNTLACILAVILCVLIKPGRGGEVSDTEPPSSSFETQDIFADLLRNFIPSNVVEVGFRKAVTKYSTVSEEVARNLTNGTIITDTIQTRSKSNGKSDSVNVLGLIFICLTFGVAANRLGRRADIFVRFFTVLTEIVLLVLRWFFWTSPVGVASLIAKAIANIDDLGDSFSKLGMFVMVVVVGIVIFQLGVLSLLLFVITRRNPFLFHLTILRPYFIGFASTSTAVAIPEMMYCCEVKNKIDKRVARFAVPFSVTLSANGSAIFIVSAAIFIAEYIGQDPSASDYIVIAFLTAVSALALPSVPSSSLVTLVIILASLNIPSSSIALLLAVEWLLDRIRSGCNVISHCQCAAVAYRFCEAGLDNQDTKSPVLDDTYPNANGETNMAYYDDNGPLSTQM
ncbi:hypothetical protein V1264_010100 [Littorina saxatilis]|uniref:Amino acid transporter n=2 Tax=Littorina saxatilis TaxID=31220 RepID=A0AAN9ANR4_9CAEN